MSASPQSPQETRAAIARLHDTYCQATGVRLPLDMGRENAWYWVLKRGVTPDDLRVLIRHLQFEIRAERRNPGCLKFRNLVGNPDYMEEDLAEARARARVPRVDPGRADVLQASGRPTAEAPPAARRASEIMPPEEATRRLREAMAAARKAIGL